METTNTISINLMACQAISTKYLGATNHRGSRIKATCPAGSLTVPFDHALNAPNNHAAAGIALARKLGWTGTLSLGGTKEGYVLVFVDDYSTVQLHPNV